MRSRVDDEEAGILALAEATALEAFSAYLAVLSTGRLGCRGPLCAEWQRLRGRPGKTLSTSTQSLTTLRSMFVSRSQWRQGHCVEMRTHHTASPLGPIGLVRWKPSASAPVSGWPSSSYNTEIFPPRPDHPDAFAHLAPHVLSSRPETTGSLATPDSQALLIWEKEMQQSLDIVWILHPLLHNAQAGTIRRHRPETAAKAAAVEVV